MSPFPTIALTYSKTFLEILFFPIYLDLKLIYESILLKNMIAFT